MAQRSIKLDASKKHDIVNFLNQYNRFLETTNFKEKELVQQFMDKDTSRKYMAAAHEFGDLMFKALTIIGENSPFHRLLVV